MSLVPHQQSLIPTKDEMDTLIAISKMAEQSNYFKKLGGSSGILCIALYAKEMGIPVMTAIMGGLQNINGKITMSAEMMNSLIHQQGHSIEILRCTHTVCEIKGKRRDGGEPFTACFTIEEAERAGLVSSGSPWQKYPSDMLFARCLSRLRRRLFPDVASRSYVEGELDEVKEEKHDTKSTVDIFDESKPIVSLIGEEKGQEIESKIGDDKEYLGIILAHYSKKYEIQLHSISEIRSDQLEIIERQVNARNKMRLEKEMSSIVEVDPKTLVIS